MKDGFRFNLEERRPQVLLLGNGITRMSGSGSSWTDVILDTARDRLRAEQYLKCQENRSEGFMLPNNPLAMAVGYVEDKERHQKYINVLDKGEGNEAPPYLKELLKLPFDAVLTTNYTYEIENVWKAGFEKLSGATKNHYRKCWYGEAIKDSYLLHRYYRFADFRPIISHIHGELGLRSTLVMTHDEYVRHMSAILEYLRSGENRYQDEYPTLEIRSWVDYLLMGDVYILGFGFDVTEFDLWWLLGRRLREKAKTGTITFYEMASKKDHYKQMALEDMGVAVKTLDFEKEEDDCREKKQASEEKPKESGHLYGRFYQTALEDLRESIR